MASDGDSTTDKHLPAPSAGEVEVTAVARSTFGQIVSLHFKRFVDTLMESCRRSPHRACFFAKSRRHRRLIVGAAVWMCMLVDVVPASAKPGDFRFFAPPGWLELSGNAPPENRVKATPRLLAEADSGKYSFVAFDPDSVAGPIVTTMNVVLRTGARPREATISLLDDVENQMKKQMAAQGLSFQALTKSVIKVAGVPAMRMVGQLGGANRSATLVQYSIPGHLSSATMTFATSSEQFRTKEAIFEAAAQATLGAQEPETPWAWRDMLTRAVLGAVFAVSAGLALKRRAKA